ncbi:MAG: TMEM175 family protein [bacterium]|nr:TMEM175 family protein [bacterium]
MSEAVAPVTPRRIDRGFRWRGEKDVSRLESFTDAVFAIVLALLFLRDAAPESFFELEAAIKSLLAALPAFAITCYLWFEHWLFSRRFNLRDGTTAFLNLTLLFLVLVYAYPLKFLFTLMFIGFFGPIGSLDLASITQGSNVDSPWIFGYYSGGYLLIFLIFVLMYRRALSQREVMQLDAYEVYQTQASLTRFYFQMAVAATSVGLAVANVGVDIGAPGWCYMILGPGMGILGYVQGNRGEKIRKSIYGESESA